MESKLIPTHTDSYDSLTFVHTKCASVYKKVGYTPLQVVRDVLPYLLPEEASRCTYVGRLDPMAEGWMHILWNGDMQEKENIGMSDKIYEIEVLLGISTDTGDALGLIKEEAAQYNIPADISEELQSFVGPFTYPYPTYSSPHIKETLKGNNTKIRLQKGVIQKIEEISRVSIKSDVLHAEIESKLSLCRMDGDFRVVQIQDAWKLFFQNNTEKIYTKIKLQVYCSAGTYMRTLAEELGKKLSVPACALHIKRIGIKTYSQ